MFKNRACVESLEPRRLLSATHPHPSPPLLTGTAFTGTENATNGTTGTIEILVTSESKTGALRGDLTISQGTAPFTGSVNAKGVFRLHLQAHHLIINATGTASTTSISGKFNSTSHHGSSHGTFAVGR